MSSALETKELEFARQVRRALDENAASIPSATARPSRGGAPGGARAQEARKPVTAPVFAPAFAGAAGGRLGPPVERRQPRAVSPRCAASRSRGRSLALVIGLAGIAYWEDQQRTAELADIDAAMLSDDLPLNAYLDHGFNAYLTRNH